MQRSWTRPLGPLQPRKSPGGIHLPLYFTTPHCRGRGPVAERCTEHVHFCGCRHDARTRRGCVECCQRRSCVRCGVGASPFGCTLTVCHDVRTGPCSPQQTGRRTWPRTSSSRRRGRDSKSEDWSDDSMLDASVASFDLDDSDTDWRTRKTRDTSGPAALILQSQLHSDFI